MPLNPEKRPAGPPKSGENPEIVVDDVSLAGRFLLSTPLTVAINPAFGLPRETIMDINNNDDRKDVQPYPVKLYPVKLWPDSRRRGEGNSPLSRRARGRGGSLGH
jgi:hypothetical protein